jgi:DNA replication initiation complex subunit (GINS family)
MDISDISYRMLREIQRKEESSPRLSKIEDDFYNVLREYLHQLNKRCQKESSPQKKMLLTDEMHNLVKIIRTIYESREKKIVLAAMSQARGGHPELQYLTETEKQLFESLLHLLRETRERQLEGKQDQKDEQEPQHEELLALSSTQVHKENGGNNHPLVLITKTLPEFIGTDKKRYAVRKDDVISLPEDMAETLIKRKAAKRILSSDDASSEATEP